MARGWESKAVEDQVQEFQQEESDKKRRQLTPSEAEAHRRREVLMLSRARVQKELELSQNPRYREQLTRALEDLDRRLAELEDSI